MQAHDDMLVGADRGHGAAQVSVLGEMPETAAYVEGSSAGVAYPFAPGPIAVIGTTRSGLVLRSS